jgi:uncharacterized Zn ribbon protein
MLNGVTFTADVIGPCECCGYEFAYKILDNFICENCLDEITNIERVLKDVK